MLKIKTILHKNDRFYASEIYFPHPHEAIEAQPTMFNVVGAHEFVFQEYKGIYDLLNPYFGLETWRDGEFINVDCIIEDGKLYVNTGDNETMYYSMPRA